MLFDSGVLTIFTLEDISEPGKMPVKRLTYKSECYYGERVVGYGRQYAARGVNEQIDMLARIWQDRSIRSNMYAVLESGEQYRISNVQHLEDDDGLRVTDLTLERLDDLYEIAG